MQLKIIKPLLVVTLGRFSMNYFYKDGKITRDHGRSINVNGFNVYPVYHPAAGLRNGDMLRTLKADFLNIPSVLENIKNPKVVKPSNFSGATAGAVSNGNSKPVIPIDGQIGLGL